MRGLARSIRFKRVVIDQRFIAIVRRHLPQLGAAEELAPSAGLFELGLDSLAMVRLLMALEDELCVTLPESSLTPETFTDTASLWRVVSQVMRA